MASVAVELEHVPQLLHLSADGFMATELGSTRLPARHETVTAHSSGDARLFSQPAALWSGRFES